MTEESTTIFVGNLPFTATEDDLRSCFEGCGPITNVRMANDQDGNFRGFGHVVFQNS